jgi:hypothetical protein
VRYEIRPLPAWTDPVTSNRRGSHTFRASWSDTLDLLGYETEKLGAPLVVIQVDASEADIRRDGMLRARAKVGHPGVVVSFESKYGPLRYATDAYEQQYSTEMPGWQANIRAVALAMQALRAVDRYGVTKRGEQYVGWRAIAAPIDGFASADDAMRWMRAKAGPDVDEGSLYRVLAKRLHPDVGGDPDDWRRLDEARRLLSLNQPKAS